MSALTLPDPMHHAYMAGKYSADAEQYLREARVTKKSGGEPWHYGYLVKAARQANRRMVGHLKSARGVK